MDPSYPGMTRKRGAIGGLALLMALPIAADESLRFSVQLYLRTLGASPLMIALGTSLCWLGISVGSILWGSLSDRWRRRRLLALLACGGAVLILVMSLLPGPTGALSFVFVRVLLVSGIAPIVLAIQSERSTLRDRGRYLSILSASRSAGFALGSMIAGIALDRLGFRYAFAVLSILPLLSLIGLYAVEDRPSSSHDVSSPAAELASRQWRPELLALYAGTVLRQMANTGTRSLIYVFMASLGIATSVMGVLNAVNPAVQVAAMFVFGWLADRVGRRRVFLLGFALSVVSTALFAVATGPIGIAVAYSVIGVAFPALFVGSASFIGDTVPTGTQGRMLGAFESSRGVGGVLGPILAGSLVPVIGFRWMIGVMAGCAALGFAIVWGGTRTTRHPPVRSSSRSLP